jgi:hypothetical protein
LVTCNHHNILDDGDLVGFLVHLQPGDKETAEPGDEHRGEQNNGKPYSDE